MPAERINIEEALKKSEERYQGLLNNFEAGIVVHAPDTSVVMSNFRASELLGLSNARMIGKEAIDPIWKFVDLENNTLPIEDYPVNRVLTSKKPMQNQVLGIYRPVTNNIVWVTVNGFPILRSTGDFSEIVISFIDITSRIRAEIALNKYQDNLEKLVNERTAELIESEKKFRSLVEKTSAVLPWKFDLIKGRFTFVGHQSETMLGFPVESWTDLDSWSALIHPDDREKSVHFCLRSTEKGEDHEFEYRCITASGKVIWLRDIISVVKDDQGTPVELIGHMLDVTESKKLEYKLKNLSRIDALTSLYNRAYLNNALKSEILRSTRYSAPLALLMLDIDFFKSINDNYGHQAGDACLVALGSILKSLSREVDTCVRYGGEEFVVILPQTDTKNAVHFAERLRNKTEALNVRYDDETIRFTISIGVGSLITEDEMTDEELLKAADSALYNAKETGRNRVVAASH